MTSTDSLERRWARPVRPVQVENTTDVVLGDDGEPRQDFNATFRADDIERFRHGRACLRCWEPLETAWPERCPVCRYQVWANQARDFARHYAGEQWVGPSTSLSEELDRLDWQHDERMWRKHGAKGILLPRGVRADA